MRIRWSGGCGGGGMGMEWEEVCSRAECVDWLRD